MTTRQMKLSAKLAAMALEIAGPICVEQTQMAREVRNDFANRTDDLDDFPAPTNAGSLTPRQSTPGPAESTLAGDRQSTQPGGKKRPNPDAAVDDAGPRRKRKVCLLYVSTL